MFCDDDNKGDCWVMDESVDYEVEHALETLAQKWEWRAQHYAVSGNIREAARLLADADAVRGHVRRNH